MANAPEASKFSSIQRRKNVQFSLFSSRLTGIVLTIGLLGVFGLTETAQAQSSSLEIAYPGSLKAATKIGKPAKIKKAGSAVIIKASYLGSAPWICTPSGFGRTSRCFAR
jgi:hypothetical protein